MNARRAVRPRVRAGSIAAAVLVCIAAAVRPIGAWLRPDSDLGAELLAVAWPTALALASIVLLGRFEWRQRAIIRELSEQRMIDRDAGAFESRMISELRDVQAFNRKIAYRLLTLDERVGCVERHTETVAGEIRAMSEAMGKAIEAAHANGYLDGMRRRPPNDPPSLRSV